MKIIVCVKQVIDTAAKINIVDGKVDAAGSPRVINPYDEYAIEEAIRIREKFPESEVTLISLGPESFRDALKTGLAMGADKAIHLLDPLFDGIDNFQVARVLEQAVRTMEFDLILCGRQAVDDDLAQVGPSLAVFLGIPCITVVTQLEFSGDLKQATATRQIEGGSEIVEAPLPLLVTCQKGLNEPRLPSLKGIMAAKKKAIAALDAAALGIDPASLGPDHNRVLQVDLALPPKRKKGQILEGTLNESAAKLVHALREEEKIV